MARKRKDKRYGKLPYADRDGKGNAQQFINDVGPRMVARVAVMRKAKGQRRDSCEGVW